MRASPAWKRVSDGMQQGGEEEKRKKKRGREMFIWCDEKEGAQKDVT